MLPETPKPATGTPQRNPATEGKNFANRVQEERSCVITNHLTPPRYWSHVYAAPDKATIQHKQLRVYNNTQQRFFQASFLTGNITVELCRAERSEGTLDAASASEQGQGRRQERFVIWRLPLKLKKD
jgi:hypothetical protein